MSIESVMPSKHLILCCPLLLLPSIFPSIRVFSNESALRIRWPKHWSFSFSISPSNEYSGLISLRIDWLVSLLSKGLSRVFSNTTIQKHQFFGAQFSSVQLLSQVQLFATKPPYPSPPRIHPIPCPSSQWCHPTISSSVVPFSSCPQSFQTSGSFPMSQLFTSGGQSTGVSASTSVLPMNTQLSLYSNSHIHTWLLEKLWLWLDGTLSANNVSAFEYAV